jgi:hypothetical protein
VRLRNVRARYAVIVRRPVKRYEHLPGIEIKQPLNAREFSVSFHRLHKGRIDVARELRRHLYCHVGKGSQVWRDLTVRCPTPRSRSRGYNKKY